MSYQLPFVAGQKIIELGGGENPAIRPNVDIRPGPSVDIVADFNDPLPMPTAEWDGIFCCYVIEHISWRKVRQFISEVYRILKPGGTVVFITANTEEQIKWVLNQPEWNDDSSSILFGGQDYEANAHKNSLSPAYATKLLREAGFDDIFIIPWGALGTDMIIEAKKKMEDRKELFDKHYFNGGQKVGGYAHEGYWDYPVHWVTFEKIMAMEPETALEIGCSRGYIVKRLQDAGVPTCGLEISTHCMLTRAADGITEWDICKTPWPYKDKAFDLCFSVAVLEHIPEEFLPAVVAEMERVSKRGCHGIDFGENDDGFDKTHCTLRPKSWWHKILPSSQHGMDKEFLESGNVLDAIPVGDGKLKLNVGSCWTMFHHGWLNIDILPLHEFAQKNLYKFVQMDVTKGLMFENGVVDLISASHFLEHLTPDEGVQFLKECKRVLKPGGVVRIAVPDLPLLMQKYQAGELGIYDEINNTSAACDTQAAKLWSLLFEGHKTAYDAASLESAARKAGFTNMAVQGFRKGNDQILSETVDMFPCLSLYFELYN
jgi:predicted SAM-dependent methyltransferase